MKNFLYCVGLIILLYGCKSKTGEPDVSGIKVELQTERFENDFFAIDTNNIQSSLATLQTKYPAFTLDFLENILGIPLDDTGTVTALSIKQFIKDYKPVKDSADVAFRSIDKYENEIKSGLQYLKFYFPQYPAPKKLITFIGPMDAFYQASTGGYGDIITTEGLGVGLQLHLGKNSTFYNNVIGQQLYPSYISRRFDPEYIPVNCMKNIIDDIFPDRATGKNLLEQMVDKGKRLYLLDKLLPNSADTLKIGYTDAQLKGSIANEALIWNFFLENNLLYENDVQKIKSYVNESPNTPELGDG